MDDNDDSPWVKARSSLVWMAAILVAFAAVWWIERESGKELIAKAGAVRSTRTDLPASPDLPQQLPGPRELTAQEKQWARIAWTYFERNTDPKTGLAGSVEGFPSTTMWDTSSQLLALLAARDLGLVDERGFDDRLALALDSLAKLPLFGGVLPNKSYDVRTLAMTDYRNQPAPAGVGWSAIDVGRLLVPLNIIAWHHPKHTAAARQAITRWNTAQLAQDGRLVGMQATAEGGRFVPLQEGRLGYEQYAARTMALVGLDVAVASDPFAHLQLVDVQGIRVPADDRDPKQFGASNVVTSEPWMLQGLEFGWSGTGRELAWRVYRAQEERFRRTGTLTAVSEDHLDRAPYFLYNGVWAAGEPWAVVTDKGEAHPQLRTLSTKTAFAWNALLRTPYTQQLVDAAAGLNDPARGWFAGRYEDGGQPNASVNANTNAVVLESLAYLARGPLLQFR